MQKEIFHLARNREIAVKFGEKGFGKRPDVLEYENDILELAKQGATSFHVSLERFNDPLKLKTGMTQKQLDELRTGFDLIIDLDTKIFEVSKICANLIIEFLKYKDVKNISLKFSGNNGMHIGIPFESFPDNVHNRDIKSWFPEGVRIVNSYIKNSIKDYLRDKILDNFKLKELAEKLNKIEEDLKENDEFNPYSVIEIDSVLISSRHLFRSVYSLNEKSGLVSIPIELAGVLKFNKENASIDKVNVNMGFLEYKGKEKDASALLIEAFDENSKKIIKEDFKKQINNETNSLREKREYELPTTAINEELFPPCMHLLLKGSKEDGRKRSVFILINFLRKMGWDFNEIERRLLEWNKLNYEPLREGYIKSQVNWSKRQKEEILPPNCDNVSYYKSMAVCQPDFFCRGIKNPMQNVMKKIKKK